ncbi:hypothetical protein M899_0102 [Bacteriovorax sp. BSW11_IV]|nr:hypothetical protein [Bacteriovorax sp. BSW11_IV]EQC44845.1 hypothetical protein M899_0102 [Bacteriovorax sp. BSW11_IV]
MSNNFKDEVMTAIEEVKNSLVKDKEISDKQMEILLLTSLLEEESQ